ncbi:MAG: hypothetical protein ACE37F_38005 [Nannocystaceae bacterium]|nr:hypothetical protein [bacterium]
MVVDRTEQYLAGIESKRAFVNPFAGDTDRQVATPLKTALTTFTGRRARSMKENGVL